MYMYWHINRILQIATGAPSLIGDATHFLNPATPTGRPSWDSNLPDLGCGQGMANRSGLGADPFDSNGNVVSNVITHVFGVAPNGDGILWRFIIVH